MIKRTYYLVAIMALLGACSSDVAPTPPERAGDDSVLSNDGGTGSTADSGSFQGDAELGVQLYDAECSGCHSPIETSAKAGATATRILDSASLPFHSSVSPWPSEQEAADLEAALAQ